MYMPENFCLRAAIDIGNVPAHGRFNHAERECASSLDGFCANSFLRLVQKGYRACISAQATTVEQLLPLKLAL